LDPETRRNEAPRAESGGAVLGRDSEPLSPSARGSGERCKFSSGVLSGAPENLDFGAFWDLKNHVRTVS